MEAAVNDPNQLALTVLQYATSGNYRALAALAVLGVVFLLRNVVLHPKLLGRFTWLAWFKTDRGGVALNFLVACLGGVGNALAAHQALTGQLVLTGMVNACIAAGVFVSLKRLAGRPAENVATSPAEAPTSTRAPAVSGGDANIITTTTTEVPK